MVINDSKYKLDDINYHKFVENKTQIVIGRSLRMKSHHIIRLQEKEFGLTKTWNTYTITRTGIVYQHYDPKYYSDFLGIKIADRQSISIVLENMGPLLKRAKNGTYVNWLTEECATSLVKKNRYLGYEYWEKFSPNQIKSTITLCQLLCAENNIPLSCVDFDFFHKDIINFNGIVFRSNYIQDCNDINPLFNIEKFTIDLLNKHEKTT